MNHPSLSPSPLPVPLAPRRRYWPWVVGLCLAPFVVLALTAVSYLSLDRDAATLRRQVMHATGSPWKTQVQVSVGSLTLGGLRTGLAFVNHPDAAKARLGLRAISRASVGVYRREADRDPSTTASLFLETDRGMRQRGWTRLVGASHGNEWVVVYVPTRSDAGRATECCVAVLKPHELVVVSVSLDADALADFLPEILPEEFSSEYRRRRQSASR